MLSLVVAISITFGGNDTVVNKTDGGFEGKLIASAGLVGLIF